MLHLQSTGVCDGPRVAPPGSSLRTVGREAEAAELEKWTPLAMGAASRIWVRHVMLDRDDLRAIALEGLLAGIRSCPAEVTSPGGWYRAAVEYTLLNALAFQRAGKRAVRPCSLDQLREAEIGFEPSELDPNLDGGIEDRELISAALAALPPREAHIVRRHYFDEATTADLGAELGVTETRVRQLLARARARMRAWIIGMRPTAWRRPLDPGS